MTRDDSKALLWRAFMPLLDGGRPAGTLGWVNAVVPVVTQAAAGAGHWAAGRRQRALAEWAGAAGFGLVAWGLGTEAPTGAEMLENLAALAGMDEQQRRDFLRKLATEAPGTAGTGTPAARRVSRFFRLAHCATTLNSYWANHCEHCGDLLGDHELHCEFDCAFMPSSESGAANIELLHIREPLEAMAAGYAIEPEYFRFMSRS